MKALSDRQACLMCLALIAIGIVFEALDLAIPGKLPIPSLVDIAHNVWRAL